MKVATFAFKIHIYIIILYSITIYKMIDTSL